MMTINTVFNEQHLTKLFEEVVKENEWVLSQLSFPILLLKNHLGEVVASNTIEEFISDHTNKYQEGTLSALIMDGWSLVMISDERYVKKSLNVFNYLIQTLQLRIGYNWEPHYSSELSESSMISAISEGMTIGNSLSQYFIEELVNQTDIAEMSLFFLNNETGNFYHEVSSNDELYNNFITNQLPKQVIKGKRSYYSGSDWGQDWGSQMREAFFFQVNDLYVIELYSEDKYYGILFIWCQDDTCEQTAFMDHFVDFINKYGRLVFNIQQLQKNGEEQEHYRLLYQVTEKFHSSMDTKDVLNEVINTIHQLYPAFQCHLILNDSESYNNLPIKHLDISMEKTNIHATQAFITGQLQMTTNHIEKTTMIYAPLKGRQGVYGVLDVSIPMVQTLRKNEEKFIRLLANTAGNALENAKLYQQSQKFIADLKLVNQASHQLNSNLRLKDILTYMKGQIIESFHAHEVGFFIFKPSFTILPGSSSFFFQEEKSHKFLKRLMKQILKGKDYLFSGDLKNENGDINISYHSLMAVPMIQNKTVIGMIIALHKEPYAFTFDSFKLLQSIVHHSTLALMNSMLREELEHLVITDHLTQLYTRNYLDKKIKKSLESDSKGLFMLIDIDNFKSINDTFGHQVGDRILIQVAEVIKQNLRECDIAARWGGEELALYFPHLNLDRGKQIANRLLTRIKEETRPSVTISCGISIWAKSEEIDMTIDSLFKQADNALYIAKTAGKNRVAY